MVKNHQAIEELEPDGPHHEQIDRYDSSRVIAEDVFQPCEGERRGLARYLPTVDWATLTLALLAA